MPMNVKRLLVAVLATVPALAIVWLGMTGLTNLFDPCFGFDDRKMQPSEECPSVSSTSQSRSDVLRNLVLIQGSVLLACVLGIYALASGHPNVVVASIIVLVIVSIPLVFGGLAILTLLTAAMLGILASSHWGRGPAEKEEKWAISDLN